MVKELLGVRTSTPNDVCLVEAGMCSADAKVKDIQREFIQKIISKRSTMTDDSFIFIWNLCKNANTKGHKY